VDVFLSPAVEEAAIEDGYFSVVGFAADKAADHLDEFDECLRQEALREVVVLEDLLPFLFDGGGCG